MDWAQVCGINQRHSAGRLSLPGDKGLVTSIFLAAALRVVAIANQVQAPYFLRDRDAAFSRVSFTLNLTIFVIRLNGIGASSGN